MKRKKLLQLSKGLSLLVLLALLVSACGGATQEAPEAETGDQQEISVLYLDDPPFWKEQADRFAEASGIKVNWEGVPFGSLHDKVLTALAGGDSPWDVIHVRDDWVAEFGSRGFLLPLDDRITPEIKGTIPTQAWDNVSWDGHNYAVPRYFWLYQAYYNTDLLKAAGYDEPPATWAEVAEMAEKLTADTDGDGTIDRWGLCETWGENFASFPFQYHLRAAGGELFDAEGKPAFNSEAGKRALTWMVEMAETDNYCPSAFELVHSGTMAELFVQGNIGMIIGTTQTFRMASDPDQSKVQGLIDAALAPGDVEPSATLAETGSLAIPATAKNPDGAWEYIKFVTSAEEQKNMALALSSIPVVTEALQDPEVQAKFPHFAHVQEQMQYPFGMLKHPNATEVNAAIARHIIAALRGTETVEEALQKAEEEVLAIGQ